MKFIHFADAHLDSPFRGLSFLPSEAFKQIHNAANISLTNIVNLAIKEQVDLVLIAGDTFDSSQPAPGSQLFFAKEIKRLTDKKIQVVMIFGNHDYMDQGQLLVEQSPYFKLLGDGEKVERATFKTQTGFEYDVIGFSYLNNHIERDMITEFPKKTNNYTFGLMHAQEKMAASQNVYAPFITEEIKQLNYNYFALGHIHKRNNLSTAPWIVYPGNIQGRHINEMGEKGCYLGEIDEQNFTTKINFVETAPILWQEKELELTAAIDKNTLQEKIVALLTSAKTTYYSLIISGAEYLTEQERELVQDTDFWQTISQKLFSGSQLVDVRFKINQKLQLNNHDQAAFDQAEKDIFTEENFLELAASWAKKDQLSEKLVQNSNFIKQVKQLTEVKLTSKLKGLSDETKEN